jgi:glutathione peroxidase
VKWNFTKFLIGRDGRVIDRFESFTAPDSSGLVKAVEEALAR